MPKPINSAVIIKFSEAVTGYLAFLNYQLHFDQNIDPLLRGPEIERKIDIINNAFKIMCSHDFADNASNHFIREIKKSPEFQSLLEKDSSERENGLFRNMIFSFLKLSDPDLNTLNSKAYENIFATDNAHKKQRDAELKALTASAPVTKAKANLKPYEQSLAELKKLLDDYEAHLKNEKNAQAKIAVIEKIRKSVLDKPGLLANEKLEQAKIVWEAAKGKDIFEQRRGNKIKSKFVTLIEKIFRKLGSDSTLSVTGKKVSQQMNRLFDTTPSHTKTPDQTPILSSGIDVKRKR